MFLDGPKTTYRLSYIKVAAYQSLIPLDQQALTRKEVASAAKSKASGAIIKFMIDRGGYFILKFHHDTITKSERVPLDNPAIKALIKFTPGEGCKHNFGFLVNREHYMIDGQIYVRTTRRDIVEVTNCLRFTSGLRLFISGNLAHFVRLCEVDCDMVIREIMKEVTR